MFLSFIEYRLQIISQICTVIQYCNLILIIWQIIKKIIENLFNSTFQYALMYIYKNFFHLCSPIHSQYIINYSLIHIHIELSCKQTLRFQQFFEIPYALSMHPSLSYSHLRNNLAQHFLILYCINHVAIFYFIYVFPGYFHFFSRAKPHPLIFQVNMSGIHCPISPLK